MKKLTTLFIMLLIAALTITAQPPQAFKYKAIARDKFGRLILNQQVAMRISILQGSESGMAVYVETHTPFTNLYGVIELEIGRGTPELGTIESIDWGASDYYIKIEMDPKNKGKGHGNEGYTVIGTSQLLSVPYALFAGHVQNSEDNDADPMNELITNAYLSGTMLTILEGGNTTLIDLSGLQDGTEDADADPENEIQDLQLVDNILTITKNGTATQIDLRPYLDNTDTQQLAINGHELSITNGNTINLPDSVNDADHDPKNELQILSIGNDTIYLSQGGFVKLPEYNEFSGSYNDLSNKPLIDGSETKINAGINVSILGSGTEINPYVINSFGGNTIITGKHVGEMMYWSGSAWTIVPTGNSGQVLTLKDGIPIWAGEPSTLIVSTTSMSNIEKTSATSGGNITTDGLISVIARGVCWSTNINPTIEDNKTLDGNGAGTFVSSLSGLNILTKYYVRAYAISNADTIYGNEVFFSTQDEVTDIDGNTYNTVQIGSQTWMAENLKTTKYNDGSEIPLVSDYLTWEELITPGYCWYNNNEATYKAPYGALYNWYTVNTGKLCPIGWHMSTDFEWNILINYVGNNSTSGGRLKEIGSTHWLSPNTGAVDQYSYTALPGGSRRSDGSFVGIGSNGNWWSTNEYSTYSAYFKYIDYNSSSIFQYYNYKQNGFSVRCVKD